MLANYEFRKYNGEERIWVGKYKNLNNLPHWHYDCELITAEQGNALISVDGKIFKLLQGQSIFINSQQVHYIQAEKNSILSFILYDNKLTETITNQLTLITPLLSHNYDVKTAFDFIDHELQQKEAFYATIIKQELISLVAMIFRHEKNITITKRLEKYNDMYKKLLVEIDENIQFITFKEAATFMSLSEPYFSNYFHKMSGMTFSQYLNHVRTDKAIALLQKKNKPSITQIAIECGFGTIRNFNRVFKNITGFAPKDLPEDYSIYNILLRNTTNHFNPTLQESELL